jgi:hypothetical protein
MLSNFKKKKKIKLSAGGSCLITVHSQPGQIPNTNKRAGRVAQGAGPEFKP